MQKNIIYIFALIIFSGSCFWAGGIGPGKRVETADSRIGEIQSQLDDSLELVGSLREENSKLVRIKREFESENIRLTGIIGELQDINERFNRIIEGISVSNGDIRQRITEAETGIGSVTNKLRSYLPENTTQEPDNNN